MRWIIIISSILAVVVCIIVGILLFSSKNNDKIIIKPSNITMPPTTTIAPTTTLEPPLYEFKSHTFTTAGKSGAFGPILAEVRNAYSGVSWAQNSEFLNMTIEGIQEWKVPVTGIYRIRAVGAGVPYINNRYGFYATNAYQKGMDVTIRTILKKGEIIKILVGQKPYSYQNEDYQIMGGAGGTFIVKGSQSSPTAILVAGGAGSLGLGGSALSSNATSDPSGNNGIGEGLYNSKTNTDGYGYGGKDGLGGGGSKTTGGGGGFLSNGLNSIDDKVPGGYSFKNGGKGGYEIKLSNYLAFSEGGFGGGGGTIKTGGAGGGYSGGGGGGKINHQSDSSYDIYSSGSGGGGGSYSITGQFDSAEANNNDNGFVVITLI